MYRGRGKKCLTAQRQGNGQFPMLLFRPRLSGGLRGLLRPQQFQRQGPIIHHPPPMSSSGKVLAHQPDLIVPPTGRIGLPLLNQSRCCPPPIPLPATTTEE